MVVPHFIIWEHGTIPGYVFCVEKGCSTAMVGDALCFCLSFYCDTPNWCNPSNYKPGTYSNSLATSSLNELVWMHTMKHLLTKEHLLELI